MTAATSATNYIFSNTTYHSRHISRNLIGSDANTRNNSLKTMTIFSPRHLQHSFRPNTFQESLSLHI
ncbi:Uncharacterized protein HZ326_15010 [Fusarium oxysporum f. sp. albedinis]|nr:Uncharacterized protein HZ326_15010 [Fusarium oxysporum f. sp. albedinis]